jgi:hypothetical protein
MDELLEVACWGYMSQPRLMVVVVVVMVWSSVGVECRSGERLAVLGTPQVCGLPAHPLSHTESPRPISFFM